MKLCLQESGNRFSPCRLLKKTIQRGRRRVETGGVPSGVRCGFRRAENEVGGLFQQPVRR